MEFLEVLSSRRSVPSFDPSVSIDRTVLLEILNTANLAPSSMCLQQWEYIVCDTPEAKARLQAASFNQKKITEASAVVIVLGNLKAAEQHAEIVADANMEAGYFGEDRRERWIASAKKGWPTERVERDEAFRGPSLWAMTFMFAAKEAGWDTAPMGGYEPDKVIAEFGLPETHIPVLLIAIGKANPEITLLPRVKRIPAETLAHFNNW